MRVRAFGELSFATSAGLAFAQATEAAQADPEREHPEAWLIEDRRIGVSFEGELNRVELRALVRVTESLAKSATSGEILIESDAGERWQLAAPQPIAGGTGSGLRTRSTRSRPRVRGAG